MSDQKAIRELLQEYGYEPKGGCWCDGYETLKYKKDNYELRWRKGQAKFQIIKGRQMIQNWTKLTELEKSLNLLHVRTEEIKG